MTRAALWGIVSAVGIGLVIILFVIGWQVGWWLKASAVNHSNHIVRESYSYQVSEISGMDADLNSITGLQTQIKLQPQNASVLNSQILQLDQDFCNDYTQLVSIQIPSNIKSYANKTCTP
jgi:hypothetical protein